MIKYKPSSNSTTLPSFSGIKTFMALPHLQVTEDVDFAIVGAPFDTASCNKTGARFAPDAIRFASNMTLSYNTSLNVDIFEHLSGIDYGDVSVLPGDVHESYRRIEHGLTPLIDANVFPVVIGGDHSITLAELRAVHKKHGKIALVHFDSHLDTWDDLWGAKYTHATPFRRACEEGLIDTAHSIQLGIRGSQYGPQYMQDSLDLGFEVIRADELHEIGIKECIKRIVDRVGDAKAFLTFDIDFVDPSAAPGTGTIEVGGFTSYESISLIRGLKDINFVAMDLVEVLPSFDQSGRTAFLAANIINELLSVLALQRRDGKR